MSTPMSPDPHSLAAAYVLNALSREEVSEFLRHLEQCESCSLDVAEMRETTAAMAASAAEPPPDALRERVLALAQTMPQLERQGPPAGVADLDERRQRRSGANRWLAGVAAAAVIAAGALGVSTYQANQRADEAQVAADDMSAVLSDPNAVVEHADVTGGGAGTFVMSPDDGRAVFMTADLPDPEPDQTYQLWAIDDGGATSVGLMQPDDGKASELVDMPPGSTAFGVTVEPSGGSDQPTTEPILLLELSA